MIELLWHTAPDRQIIAAANDYNRELRHPIPIVMVPLNRLSPDQPDTAEVNFLIPYRATVRRFTHIQPPKGEA